MPLLQASVKFLWWGEVYKVILISNSDPVEVKVVLWLVEVELRL